MYNERGPPPRLQSPYQGKGESDLQAFFDGKRLLLKDSPVVRLGLSVTSVKITQSVGYLLKVTSIRTPSPSPLPSPHALATRTCRVEREGQRQVGMGWWVWEEEQKLSKLPWSFSVDRGVAVRGRYTQP